MLQKFHRWSRISKWAFFVQKSLKSMHHLFYNMYFAWFLKTFMYRFQKILHQNYFFYSIFHHLFWSTFFCLKVRLCQKTEGFWNACSGYHLIFQLLRLMWCPIASHNGTPQTSERTRKWNFSFSSTKQSRGKKGHEGELSRKGDSTGPHSESLSLGNARSHGPASAFSPTQHELL